MVYGSRRIRRFLLADLCPGMIAARRRRGREWFAIRAARSPGKYAYLESPTSFRRCVMLEIPGIWERPQQRRQFLREAGLSGIAAMLNQTMSGPHAAAALTAPSRPIKSCIVVMLYGGPSQLETWDPKPRAPSEIRGEYPPIATAIPGRLVSEQLPRCAKILDRLAVVRSLHHGMGNHNSAMYQALVGRPPKVDLDILGADRSIDFPNVGAALSFLTAAGRLPRTGSPLVNVALPHVMHNVVDLAGQNAGFLLGEHDPFQLTTDPNAADFTIPDLTPPAGVTLARLDERLSLRARLENSPGKDGNPRAAMAGMDGYQQRALELIRSKAVRQAFQIADESGRIRERYGRNTLGQSLLLARKLVEAGVRFINVNDKVYNGQDANWDSHANIFPRHRELLPPFDQGFATLIEDLDERGLLDETLVVAMGEFGRTPRVNGSAGRDHWPNCYSAVFAGGGAARGAVFGESDREAAYPISNAVTPGDLVATLLWRFGIDPKHEIHDLLGRPLPLAEGSPIKELFPGAN